jgi:uncharacterized protein
LDATKMLVYNVSQIPPEGIDIDVTLDPSVLHLEAEKDFAFKTGHLKGRLEKGEEDSVHVRGHLDWSLAWECGRCLTPFTLELDQELDLICLPHQAPQSGQEEEDEVELSDRDIVVGYYTGDRLDLAETVREQVYLNLPPAPVCREDCKGLCPTCGQDLNQGQCQCTKPQPVGDPRLAVLGELFSKKK